MCSQQLKTKTQHMSRNHLIWSYFIHGHDHLKGEVVVGQKKTNKQSNQFVPPHTQLFLGPPSHPYMGWGGTTLSPTKRNTFWRSHKGIVNADVNNCSQAQSTRCDPSPDQRAIKKDAKTDPSNQQQWCLSVWESVLSQIFRSRRAHIRIHIPYIINIRVICIYWYLYILIYT